MTSLSEEYRLAAKDWVDKKAAATLLEETKTAYLSRMMSKLGDIPVSRAEMQVKASDEWQEFIEKMVEARRLADLASVKKDWIEMRSWEQRDTNATARAEMKL